MIGLTANVVSEHLPTQAPRATVHPRSAVPTAHEPDHDERSFRAQRTAELLNRLAETTDEQRRHDLVDELVVVNLGVAHSIAVRYRNRGISVDDLEQVARLGLVKAAQAFDPARQNDFLAYAVPTIRGEVRKHFRDHGWTVRPPRRIQELQSRIMAAAAELTQSLGRSPRPSEIARHLDAGRRGGARGAVRRRLLQPVVAGPPRLRGRELRLPRRPAPATRTTSRRRPRPG